jgi:hypothetical protein
MGALGEDARVSVWIREGLKSCGDLGRGMMARRGGLCVYVCVFVGMCVCM